MGKRRKGLRGLVVLGRSCFRVLVIATSGTGSDGLPNTLGRLPVDTPSPLLERLYGSKITLTSQSTDYTIVQCSCQLSATRHDCW